MKRNDTGSSNKRQRDMTYQPDFSQPLFQEQSHPPTDFSRQQAQQLLSDQVPLNPILDHKQAEIDSNAHYGSLPHKDLRFHFGRAAALSNTQRELSSIRQDLQAFKDGMVKRELRLASPTPDSGNVYTFTLKRYEGPASETESKSKKYEGEASEVNRINGLRPQALAKTTLHRGDINRYLQNVKTGEGRHSIRGFKVVGDTGDIRDRVEE
jgi:hypothetical protein